jgi:F420-non-reducing hydrogenase large subunit
MTSLIFPLSRIEGHARVVIEIDGEQILSARFEAMEYRGFERFLIGTPAEQMPIVVPRVCGVCSTAHHVAAVKALEDAYGITPPPLARKIRELLLLGQLIQNQATSIFLFTMPDRLGTESMFQEESGVNTQTTPIDIANQALKVRKAGTDLISLSGGQFIHPIKAVIGGVISGIKPADAEATADQLQDVLPTACDLFDIYWQKSLDMRDRIGTWGDDEPAFYISAVQSMCPNFDGDMITIMSPEGKIKEEFHPKDYRKHLQYQETDYSYAGQTSYKDQVIQANSLARINMTDRMGTRFADSYLRRFEQEFGKPAHGILLYDLARGIELVYGLERAIEILREPLHLEDTDAPYKPRDGQGFGLVEAPRGPLIHHYSIQDGKISRVKFIIPTVHNSLAIERALISAAKRLITKEHISHELEKAVGRVVRAFDPCIACATH